MIDFLKSWIISIISLVLLLVLLEIILPSGKTKKFVSLISGFILIIAIINPILGALKNGIDLKEFQVSDSNFLDRKEIEQKGKILEEEQMQQIIETYRKKVINQLEDTIKAVNGVENVKADVMINEDYTQERFGEILRVYVHVGLEQDPSLVKPVSKVEKVEIGKRPSGTPEEKQVDSKLKAAIEEKVNHLFDIEKENIVVSLLDE